MFVRISNFATYYSITYYEYEKIDSITFCIVLLNKIYILSNNTFLIITNNYIRYYLFNKWKISLKGIFNEDILKPGVMNL